MKALKIFGISIISLIIIVTVLGLFIPKSVSIERSVEINANMDIVYPNVLYLEKMHNWSPWKEYDPQMKTFYEGIDGQVGAIYKWSGNEDVGEGYQKITNIDPMKHIDLDLVFTAPWEAQSKVYFTLEDLNDKTIVKWGFNQKTPFPMNLVMAAFGMKKNLSKDFDRGLGMLKAICEGQ